MKAENIKTLLFRQPELRDATEWQLLNSVFKLIDAQQTFKITGRDISNFLRYRGVEFPEHVYSRLINLFVGQANFKLDRTVRNLDYLVFADFMLMIWPRHNFKLKASMLFEKDRPVYQQNGLKCSEETRQLLAEIFCMYVEFIQEMTQLCHNVLPMELFNQIARGKTSFGPDELFSFLLNLPVIFSTYDTEVICNGF